jgi:hypothetical protein
VLLDAILHLAGIGLVLLGLQQLPIPEGWTLKLESGRISWLGAVGLALALLPVTLWGRVTAASISWTIPDRFLARRFGPVFLYALLAVIATRVLKLAAFAASNAFVPATVLVLVGAGLYLLLWWATRRHFTKADLVTSSA